MDGMCDHEKIRRLKRQAHALISMIDLGENPEHRVERAGGGAVCPVCGLEYFDHPEIYALKAVLLCTGGLFHL